MKFQLVSDAHGDFYAHHPRDLWQKKDDLIANGVDTLLLGGDMASLYTPEGQLFYGQLFSRASEDFSHVVVIAGNHEHYGGDAAQTVGRLKTLASRWDNIVVLDNETWHHPDGTTVLGTTLWSHIPDGERHHISASLSDYKYIRYQRRKLTVADTLHFHTQSRRWLGETLVATFKEQGDNIHPIVVLTHHAPLLEKTSPPRYASSTLTSAFATDLSVFVEAVNVWAFGHTHHADRWWHDGCHMVTNAVGYGHERTGFDRNLVIDTAASVADVWSPPRSPSSATVAGLSHSPVDNGTTDTLSAAVCPNRPPFVSVVSLRVVSQ